MSKDNCCSLSRIAWELCGVVLLLRLLLYCDNDYYIGYGAVAGSNVGDEKSPGIRCIIEGQERRSRPVTH